MKKIMLMCVLYLGGGGSMAHAETAKNTKTALFAAGCFWCIQPPFDQMAGVLKTTVGYTAGHTENPSYQEVSKGTTGHTEAIEVTYNPEVVSYEKLLEVFWQNVDPFDAGGQFCDRGSQYRAGVYFKTPAEEATAKASAASIGHQFDQPVAVEIVKATSFYPAEEYHQGYYKKNPVRYKYYRYGCGRDKRLKAIWGDEAKK